MTDATWDHDPLDWPDDDCGGSAILTGLLLGAVALGVGLLGGVWALEKALNLTVDRHLGWTGDPTSWGTIESWGKAQ